MEELIALLKQVEPLYKNISDGFAADMKERHDLAVDHLDILNTIFAKIGDLKAKAIPELTAITDQIITEKKNLEDIKINQRIELGTHMKKIDAINTEIKDKTDESTNLDGKIRAKQTDYENHVGLMRDTADKLKEYDKSLIEKTTEENRLKSSIATMSAEETRLTKSTGDLSNAEQELKKSIMTKTQDITILDHRLNQLKQ